MKLHELKASAGARKAVTRKGRGAGSGNGTSWKRQGADYHD